MNLTSHTTLGGAKHAAHTAGYITSGPARYSYLNTIIEEYAGSLAMQSRFANSSELPWLHWSMDVIFELEMYWHDVCIYIVLGIHLHPRMYHSLTVKPYFCTPNHLD